MRSTTTMRSTIII